MISVPGRLEVCGKVLGNQQWGLLKGKNMKPRGEKIVLVLNFVMIIKSLMTSPGRSLGDHLR